MMKPYLSMFLLILLLGQTYANDLQKIPPQCLADCESDYGVVLGVSPAGIAAYSNCNYKCVVFEPNHHSDVYTGIKWQCVEYARRWLLQQKQVVFGDVDIAADIWGLEQVTNPINKKTFTFESITNGAEIPPKRGDLLIYSEEYLGTGHVAVVVSVNEEQKTINVAEQNFENKLWKEKYARSIKYIVNEDRIWILDQYLVGWKRARN